MHNSLDGYAARYSAIGFLKLTDEGYTLVDAQMRAKLLEAFGDSLSLELYAVENPDSEQYPDYARCYPSVTEWGGFGWPCGVRHSYSKETAGTWVYLVKGSIDGNTVESTMAYRHEPRKPHAQ